MLLVWWFSRSGRGSGISGSISFLSFSFFLWFIIADKAGVEGSVGGRGDVNTKLRHETKLNFLLPFRYLETGPKQSANYELGCEQHQVQGAKVSRRPHWAACKPLAVYSWKHSVSSVPSGWQRDDYFHGQQIERLRRCLCTTYRYPCVDDGLHRTPTSDAKEKHTKAPVWTCCSLVATSDIVHPAQLSPRFFAHRWRFALDVFHNWLRLPSRHMYVTKHGNSDGQHFWCPALLFSLGIPNSSKCQRKTLARPLQERCMREKQVESGGVGLIATATDQRCKGFPK